MKKYPVIIISGATATGKTSLSIDLALQANKQEIPCEVVNFDSLLFYKDLNIGTAKPSEEEKAGVPHHLIDTCSFLEEMNASRFCELALPLINDLHNRGITPILVGGSAFYIRALVKGMYETSPITDEAKRKAAHLIKEEGLDGLRSLLLKVDPISHKSLHENDEYRNVRAIEHYFTTGRPISEEKKKFEENDPYDFSRNNHPNWKIFHLYLEVPKEEHWNLMLQRTEIMLKNGLLQEVQKLLGSDPSAQAKSLQSIGYKETIDYINGRLESEEELKERIYISTRQLSKSQKTFFKKIHPKREYNPLKERDIALKEGLDFLSENK